MLGLFREKTGSKELVFGALDSCSLQGKKMSSNENFLEGTERQPNVNSPNAAPGDSSGCNDDVCFTDIPIVGEDLFPARGTDDADIVITDESGTEVTPTTLTREPTA